jgi:predicted nucleotidyltransferase
MDVHPGFFKGKEEQPEATLTQDRGSHCVKLLVPPLSIHPAKHLAQIETCRLSPIRRQSMPIMQHSIATLLFPEYRRRVLGLLLLRPDLALHGREIARRTGLSPGTITRELGKLADVGLLKREKRGNQQVYSADTTAAVYPELAGILRKTSGLADVLVDALAPLDGISLAFVFGSVAQGHESANSDVDVMIVGSAGFREVVRALHPAQGILGREVNPKVMSRSEFASMRKEDPFLIDVLSRPRLLLIGTFDDAEEPAGNQPRGGARRRGTGGAAAGRRGKEHR